MVWPRIYVILLLDYLVSDIVVVGVEGLGFELSLGLRAQQGLIPDYLVPQVWFGLNQHGILIQTLVNDIHILFQMLAFLSNYFLLTNIVMLCFNDFLLMTNFL